MTSIEKKHCLVCNLDVPRDGLINHIAEHINYKRHKCDRCGFRSVLVEAMVDHQTLTGHRVEIDSQRNWFMERVCQLIYCDFDYAEKHGEEAIRKMGSVFADRARLMEMLKADEIKQEHDVVVIEADEESDGGNMMEIVQQQNEATDNANNPSMISQAANTRRVSGGRNEKAIEANQQIELDPNPGSSTQSYQRQPYQNQNGTRNNKLQLMRRREEGMSSSSSLTPREINRGDSSRPVPAVAAENVLTSDAKKKQLLADLQRQITGGVDQIKCKMCVQSVQNDYASQKKHVLDRHMTSIPTAEHQTRFVPLLEQCFMRQRNRVFITNDLQCNLCGRECRYKSARFSHVSTDHYNYRWNCIFDGCSYEISSWIKFQNHMNQYHRKRSTELEKGEKDRYSLLKAEYELLLTPLVRKCFPFDLPSMHLPPTPNGKKETTPTSSSGRKNENVAIDETTCRILPTREIPQQLTPVNQQPKREHTDASDPSSDEDEDVKPPEIKKANNRDQSGDKAGRGDKSGRDNQMENFQGQRKLPTTTEGPRNSHFNQNYHSKRQQRQSNYHRDRDQESSTSRKQQSSSYRHRHHNHQNRPSFGDSGTARQRRLATNTRIVFDNRGT